MSSITPLSPEFNVDRSDVRRVISVLVLTFIFATLTIVPLRFLSKWKLNASLLLEDWLILGASIFAAGSQWTFIQCIFPASVKPRILPLNIYQAAFIQELGRHVEYNGSNAQISFRKKMYACQLLYVLAVCLTKLSILAFYWRAFRPSQTMQVIIGAMVVVVICASVGFFITSAFQCSPIREAWDIVAEGTCIDAYVFFLINAAFNIFTNFSLLVLPLHSIWKLQIPQSKKFMISCLLTLGGLIIVISILRLRNLMHLDLTSADITWKMVFPTIWSSVDMQVGIFCACLPFLRSLFTEYCHKFWIAAIAMFSAGRRRRLSARSQILVESDENLEQPEGEERKTVVTRAWAERSRSVDEEKWAHEIMVTKVIEWSTEK